MSVRERMYRGFFKTAHRLVSGVVPESARPSLEWFLPSTRAWARTGTGPRYWFHAASAGEVEILWPVVAREAQAGAEFFLTCWSRSGLASVARLAAEVQRLGGTVVYSGAAPWEGAWREWLAVARPDVWVTAKYEAWPELWASLANEDIPLFILGAQNRPSLRIARRAVNWGLGARLPELHLVTVRESDASELGAIFRDARIQNLGDPRWERVYDRLIAGSERARAILDQAEGRFPRPWGALAQTWPEDWEIWQGVSFERGTLWVIPHQVDEESVRFWHQALLEQGFAVERSSMGIRRGPTLGGSAPAVLVDEVGVLLELYSAMDWAYVGGGFGKGVHSTLEPAVQGIPIASGTARAGLFAEIEELERLGQLTLIKNSDDAAAWVEATARTSSAERSSWRQAALAKRGATDKVARALRELALSRAPKMG